MEVLLLVEFLELAVNCLSLRYIRFHWQIFLVFLCDEIFEFLLYFQLSQSLLQSLRFVLHKLRQIVLDFLIGIKGKGIFG